MSAFMLPSGRPKTVIVTGGAGGIGAQTIRTYHAHGCNVVIADLPFAKDTARSLIASLSESDRALFHETDITDWEAMRSLFRATKEKFGQVDIVIANAGLMESKGFFDFEEDEKGELKESKEADKVIGVNLKGSMNSKRTFSINVQPLTISSTQTGHARDEIQPIRRGWGTRICDLDSIDLWVLWWDWRGSVYLI